MSPPEGRNPEHRSNNALLCFCIGVALTFLAQFLGMGAVITAVFSGGDPAVIVGSAFAALGIVVMGVAGVLLALIGGLWMIIRVIADQRGDASEKRYRDVER